MKSTGPSETKGLGVPGDPGEGFSLNMAPPPGARKLCEHGHVHRLHGFDPFDFIFLDDEEEELALDAA